MLYRYLYCSYDKKLSSRPVGMPHMQQVTVQNLEPDKSLHLLSISGSTQHFHCSFFQDKVGKCIPTHNEFILCHLLVSYHNQRCVTHTSVLSSPPVYSWEMWRTGFVAILTWQLLITEYSKKCGKDLFHCII